jgi:hypothetical protein
MKQIAHIRFLYVAFFALAAAQSALAAENKWTGAVDSKWNESGNWSRNIVPNANDNDWLIFDSSTPATPATVEFDGYYVNAGAMTVRNIGDATTPLVFKASNSACGAQLVKGNDCKIGNETGDAYLRIENGTWLTQGKSLWIGKKNSFKGGLTLADGASLSVGYGIYFENAGSKLSVESGASLSLAKYFCARAGEVKVENGTIEVNSNCAFELGEHSAASLLLNEGGMLITKNVAKKTNGGTVLFNGGTLRSNKNSDSLIDNALTVTVGALGGTIDNGGFNVTVAATLGGNGGLSFTGSGTTTLNGNAKYTGATAVTPGTTLAVANETAKNNILANGLVVAGVPTAGQTVMTYTADLTGADLSKVTCPLRPGTVFAVGGDGNMSIVVESVGAALDNYWTGAVDNDLSNDANWSSGSKPTDNANIFSTNVVTLTKGGVFAPSSITFLAGSAAVAIAGDFTDMTSVTNNSSVNQTFAGRVAFEDNIDVTQTGTYTESGKVVSGGCVVFAGGVTGNDIVNHKVLTGHYTLTKNEDFTATAGSSNRTVVNANSTLSVKNAGTLTELYIKEGGAVTAAVVSVESGRLSCWNEGEFVITNGLTVSGSKNSSVFTGHSDLSSSSPVFKMEKVLCSKTDNYTFYFGNSQTGGKGTFFIGKGGLGFGTGKAHFAFGYRSGEKTTIRPWYDDFSMERGSGNAEFDIYVERDTIFNTDDEQNIGRKITVDSILRFRNDATFTVSGAGKVLVNSVASNTYQPPVTVTNTATLAIKPGALLTTSNITVNADATLQVPQSDTLELGCDLTLKNNACLGFNYTTREAPVLNLTNKTVTFDEGDVTNVVVNISADVGKRAKSGANVLTSGGKFEGVGVSIAAGAPDWVKGISVNESGNIVLNVKPLPMIFIVR